MADQERSRGKQGLHRETAEVADATARLIRAVGRRLSAEDVADLEQLLVLERALAEAWTDAVNGLRATGFADREIGEMLGITRQAVEQRWPPVERRRR